MPLGDVAIGVVDLGHDRRAVCHGRVVEGQTGQRCDTGVSGCWRKRGGGNDVAVGVELAEDPAVGRFAAQDTDRPDLADRVDIEFGCWASGGRRRKTRVDGRCRGGLGVGGLLAAGGCGRSGCLDVGVRIFYVVSTATAGRYEQCGHEDDLERAVPHERRPAGGPARIDMRGIMRLVSEVEVQWRLISSTPRSRSALPRRHR